MFKHHWSRVLRVFFAALIAGIGTIFTVFALSFAQDPVYGNNLKAANWLWVVAAGNAISVVSMPLFAMLSDRIGRRPIFVLGDLGCIVLTAIMLWRIASQDIVGAAVAGIILFGIPYAMTNAVWPVTYCELFATKDRVTGMAIGTQFSFALAGFAPTFCALLVGVGGSPNWVGPAIYGGVIGGLSAISVLSMKETFRVPMEELGLTKAQLAELEARQAGAKT